MYDKRVRALLAFVFILGVGFASVSDAALVGWWKFNDGSGTVAKDSSGKGYDGAITNPVWAEGKFGGALSFTGTNYVDVPAASWSTIRTQATVCFWAYGDPALQPQANFIFGAFSDPANNEARRMSAHVPWSDGTIYFDTGGPGYNRISKAGSASDYEGVWTFWTFLKNADTGDQQIYINGVLWHSGTGMRNTMEGVTKFTIGTKPSLAEGWYRGMIDDFRLYDTALSIEEIQQAMTGRGPGLGQASDPIPATESTDVPFDVALGWTAGQFAATHDVYLGTAFADVNDASREATKGVLVSQGQAAATYELATPLEYGQTYYWRVDEVNAAPDNTIYKGEVWSFTAEPFSYPITGVAATASSQSRVDAGPQNTVNGSGLNAEDQHSVELTQMWMSGNAKPHWIQYEFDKVYKLDELWVWNANQVVEAFVGFGAKNVTIEYSADGATWTALEGVPEFARAAGAATYTANTVVDFGGVEARYVKLTIDSNWGGVAQQVSLSEVRFFQVPMQAFKPQPEVGATGVSVTTDLNWRPGREATSHRIAIGTDNAAVAAGAGAQAVTEHTYTPADLAYGTQYFWKVDELGGTEYAGDLWDFTTEDYATVDDFEIYGDDPDAENTIWQTWIDGLTDKANGGSQVGYDQAPFAERVAVNSGKQSMPLTYDNSAGAFAEARRTFDPAQNWTARGVKSLSLYFYGAPENSGQLYVKINNNKIVYDGPAVNLRRPVWRLWNIDLTKISGVASVRTLTIGIEGSGAKGKLYIDDLRLYPQIIVVDDSSPDISGPGDTVKGVPDDGDWPATEYPALAIDDNVSTKYLHRKGGTVSTGFQVAPLLGSTIVTGLTFTTANDVPTRDPIKFELSGSNAGIDGPYQVIASGNIVDFAGAAEWPRFTKNTTPITFANTTPYKFYQILFPDLRGTTETLMQIAEVEFIGTAQ